MHDEKGLTLVEVLISLVILVIGIFAVLTMHTTSVQNNKISRERTEALHHANKEIEKIITKDLEDLDSTDYPKQVSLNTSGPEYEVDIEAMNDELSNIIFEDKDMFEFELTVSWSSFGQTQEIKIPFQKSKVGMSKTIKENQE